MPVLGELELAWRLLPNEFVAVTGTNGKTTTTEWIGHIHREAALPVAVAGNVGTAVSSLVGRLDPRRRSSARPRRSSSRTPIAFAPEAAVLLNLSPDHLDRHGTFEDYVAAKLKIFANQGNDDVAVRRWTSAIEDLGGCARRVPFGSAPGAEAVGARRASSGGTSEPLLRADEIALPGEHNLQQRDGRRRRLPGARDRPRRRRRGPADLRRRRPPARADRGHATASPTSTTPRPPTSPARSSALAAYRRAACT